ncbi:class I SAM-dependent methyltransferase [Methylocystis parvus]|uniref:class I SAM-dependent methyltransferase n=1 Tax=Methylocystis parvus TaxID=134 RepID=UPI003C7543C9
MSDNAQSATPNSDDAVTWSYRLFLDREPENSEAATMFRGLTTAQLRKTFLSSEEYRHRSGAHIRDVSSAASPIVEAKIDNAQAKKLSERVARTWTELGKSMPHWSVLSSDQFRPANIDAFRDSFYASGGSDLAVLLATLSRIGVDAKRLRSVLEFGCGVGRVTNFLAQEFAEVIAIDISQSHMLLAKEHVEGNGAKNVVFNLAKFPDFGMKNCNYDLWYSRIVLQHNPPPVIRAILQRAFEGLNPGGVAVFQVPTFATGYQFQIDGYLGREDDGKIEMHCLPMDAVFEVACEAGCVPVEVMTDDSVTDPGWISSQFVIKKPNKLK